MRVKCLAQEHNAAPWPGLEPGPPDPESSALTNRPPRLPWTKKEDCFSQGGQSELAGGSSGFECELSLLARLSHKSSSV